MFHLLLHFMLLCSIIIELSVCLLLLYSITKNNFLKLVYSFNLFIGILSIILSLHSATARGRVFAM